MFRLDEGEASVFVFVSGAREEMKFLTRACGSDVENALRLFGLAIASDAVHPNSDFASLGAFRLQRRDEELGDVAGTVRLLKSTFEP